MSIDWTFLAQVSVALSAIVATATFVVKVVGDRGHLRAQKLLDWQETVIHQMFQRSAGPLTFDEITQRYRSEAAAFTRHDIAKEELTADALRSILIRMVRGRILDQKGSDSYALLRLRDEKDEAFPTDLLNMFGQFMGGVSGGKSPDAIGVSGLFPAVSQMIEQRMGAAWAIEDAVVTLARDEPFKYSVSDLVLHISRRYRIDDDEFVRAAIYKLISGRQIVQDSNGRLGPP
jgi:hypothetical protein